MNPFTKGLLASTVLTAVGSGSFAATFVENSTVPVIADFSNTAAGANPINFASFQSVQGNISSQNPVDHADFFSFTGLTVGDNFSITFHNVAGNVDSFIFTAGGFTDTLMPGGTRTETGVLGSTSLTVGVTIPSPTQFGFAEGYSVTLSETATRVPEPSAMAIFAIGLGGLAAARRKRRRQT
jgi:hypothetical protein